jgi:putative Mn2+ efflux pump MntP
MLVFDRLASVLLFGLAANADNLTVGTAYGMKNRLIGIGQNLLIAGVTTAVTLIAMMFGRQVRMLLPAGLPDLLGGGLLIGFAAWNFYAERGSGGGNHRMPMSRFIGRSDVGLQECMFLAAALSINNVGLAIAGGIGGVGYIPTALSIFGFSVTMLALGQIAGRGFSRAPSVPLVLRNPAYGNAVLALAGCLMLAGY